MVLTDRAVALDGLHAHCGALAEHGMQRNQCAAHEAESDGLADNQRTIEGHTGGRRANISWRSRMRWLDDGGR